MCIRTSRTRSGPARARNPRTPDCGRTGPTARRGNAVWTDPGGSRWPSARASDSARSRSRTSSSRSTASAILIRGVNRAETDPATGRHAIRARMEQDVRLMKRLNVNARRGCPHRQGEGHQ
ncbi:glycoside hydrolase family 2 TIM barrel-domain containing protein [Streptomyces sp. NPDC007875]|uniref:glycoside hydrolase family 2 TIM barrel-domain containing protein n=1 Tax=Streptomyces sp. NPDC007875 TaxID=3364783 RepID=UPI00369C56C8